MSRRNEELEAVLSELAEAGVRDVIRSQDNKHIQVRWEARGSATGPRMYVVPSTPSDVRGVQNARSGIRWILKEDGMLPEPVKPPAPKMPDKATLLERRVSELETTVEELKAQMSALVNSALEIGLSIPIQAPVKH
jgi:hypothetical protein